MRSHTRAGSVQVHRSWPLLAKGRRHSLRMGGDLTYLCKARRPFEAARLWSIVRGHGLSSISRGRDRLLHILSHVCISLHIYVHCAVTRCPFVDRKVSSTTKHCALHTSTCHCSGVVLLFTHIHGKHDKTPNFWDSISPTR